MTFVIVREFAVRTKAIVSVLAPEQAVIAVLHRRIPFGVDELTFPVQILATIHADVNQPGSFHVTPSLPARP